MTEPHAPAAGSTAQAHFTPQEWEALQASDRNAAAHIVCLMAGIFVTGLIMYLVIAYIAA
jgi:hypothetical protein